MTYFLLLYLVHLLADFSLQPLSWIKDRKEKKVRSTKLLYHVGLHVLLTALVIWDLQYWYLLLILGITHWTSDVWKSYQKPNLISYLIDQLFHALILALLSLWLVKQEAELYLIQFIPQPEKWLTIACATLLSLRPSGMAVMYFMQKFELDDSDNHALRNAGQWIGYFERLIILMSVLVQAYAVIGLLVAAKSLLRYNENNRNRKHTEYVLVGSLLSWGLGIALGLASRTIMY